MQFIKGFWFLVIHDRHLSLILEVLSTFLHPSTFIPKWLAIFYFTKWAFNTSGRQRRKTDIAEVKQMTVDLVKDRITPVGN